MGIVLHSEVCCWRSTSRPSFGHGHSHGGSHGHSHGRSHSQNNSNSNHSNHNSTSPRHLTAMESDVRQPLLDSDEENMEIPLNSERVTDNTSVDIEMDNIEVPKQPHPKNINVRAAFIHVIGDIIQSLGVLLASVIMKLKPEDKYRLADPICTFLFSVLVLFTTISVLKDTLRIIMEGVPQGTDYYSIKTSLQKLKGVKAVHGLSVWCLTLEKNALAVHIAVDPAMDHQSVLEEATQIIRQNYNFIHMTIQVENYKANLSASCSDCQELKK